MRFNNLSLDIVAAKQNLNPFLVSEKCYGKLCKLNILNPFVIQAFSYNFSILITYEMI